MTRNLLLPGVAIALFFATAIGACATTNGHVDRGIRAYGTTPGWILTLRPDHWITLETNDSGRRYVVQTPDARQNGKSRTYHAKTDDLDLTLVLTRQTCRDASGEQQALTATVTANGKTYKGCAHAI